MTRIAILDDYQHVAMTMADWSALPPDCELVVFDRNLATEDEAARALADFDVVCLLRERMPMPRTLIERLPALKLIVVTGAHNRTLDLAAAKERGITVSHTRGGDSQYATPELAWGLILSLMRHIPQEHQRMREGGWQETVGTALHGRTLSILGLGRLGSRMASIGRAFGMAVLAWSQNLTAERAEAAGAALVAKDELFARADVLTIHLVLGERSRGLVGAAELRPDENKRRPGQHLARPDRRRGGAGRRARGARHPRRRPRRLRPRAAAGRPSAAAGSATSC